MLQQTILSQSTKECHIRYRPPVAVARREREEDRRDEYVISVISNNVQIPTTVDGELTYIDGNSKGCRIKIIHSFIAKMNHEISSYLVFLVARWEKIQIKFVASKVFFDVLGRLMHYIKTRFAFPYFIVSH